MTISLSPEQHARLKAQVEKGDFRSIEEAALQLIDEKAIEGDDLAWAKTYVDEALAEAAEGKTSSREQHEKRMDAVIASMKA